jgi:peroxiredoxin
MPRTSHMDFPEIHDFSAVSRATIRNMSRLKPILFFAIVGAAALLFVLHKPASAIVNIGDVAPEFTTKDEHGNDMYAIKDEKGNPLKLSDYRGNVVFLNFWYTTCEPCRLEMPDMELMNRTFKDRKFKMIPISVDTNFDDVKKFYQDFKLTSMPMYLDPGKQIASRYNTISTNSPRPMSSARMVSS